MARKFPIQIGISLEQVKLCHQSMRLSTDHCLHLLILTLTTRWPELTQGDLNLTRVSNETGNMWAPLDEKVLSEISWADTQIRLHSHACWSLLGIQRTYVVPNWPQAETKRPWPCRSKKQAQSFLDMYISYCLFFCTWRPPKYLLYKKKPSPYFGSQFWNLFSSLY